MKKIKGPYSVLMTPFRDGKVDLQAYRKQIGRLNGTGISGYVVNGSTGEFVQMTLAEQTELIFAVAEEKAKDKKTVVSACTGNLADTCELCRRAEEAGADAVLVCPPYYFTYTKEDRLRYFERLADLSPVPVLLYNIPFFTQEIETDIVFRLFRHENVIGIKDSSANMKRLEHMAEMAKNTEISVLTGTDDILFPALVGGCDGSMTAFATVFPEKICTLYWAVESGNYALAKEIQFSLLPLLRKAESETFPRGYKRLMEEVSGIPFRDKEVKRQ